MAKRSALHQELVDAIAEGDVERARMLGGDMHKFKIVPLEDPPASSKR